MARVRNPPALSQTHAGAPRHRGGRGEAADYCCRYSLSQNQVPSQLPLTWKDWILATIGQLRTRLRSLGNSQECFSLGGYFSKATMPLIGQPIEVNPWGENKWRQSRWALQVHVNGTIHQASHLFPPQVYLHQISPPYGCYYSLKTNKNVWAHIPLIFLHCKVLKGSGCSQRQWLLNINASFYTIRM